VRAGGRKAKSAVPGGLAPTRTALIAVVVGLVVLGAARSPAEVSGRPEPVRLAAQTQLQGGEPAPAAVLSAVVLSAGVLSATQQPTPPAPAPAPVYSRPAPVQTYPRPAPVQTYPRPAPVYPRPAPVQTYPRPAPVYPRPAPGHGPDHQHPAPAVPAYPQPVPAYPRGRPTPTQGRPTPAPVQPRVHPVPVPLQPRPVPVSPRPGQTLVQVPRVIGSGLYVAEQMLQERGLTVGSVTVQDSDGTPGAVVRSNPPAFTSLPVGSAVNLVVANPR
jgi:hypothetical protein